MDNLEKDIKEKIDKRSRRRGASRVWIPLLLICLGSLLLVRQIGVGVPEWIFSWPMILIVVGVFSGIAHAFRGPGWLIMIIIGSFFLVDQLVPGMDIHRFIWPGVIILVGLVLLIRPKKPYWMEHDWHQKWNQRDWERWQRRRHRRGYPGNWGRGAGPGNPTGATDMNNPGGPEYQSGNPSTEDYIDATTVLGGIHKNIISKNFKGGDITIFMGGAEINLSQADIQGTAALDITQIMGGTKIIVPSNWEIRSQLTSVFGNIEDKRQNINVTDSQKVLILDGTSVFGGIEIRNY